MSTLIVYLCLLLTVFIKSVTCFVKPFLSKGRYQLFRNFSSGMIKSVSGLIGSEGKCTKLKATNFQIAPTSSIDYSEIFRDFSSEMFKSVSGFFGTETQEKSTKLNLDITTSSMSESSSTRNLQKLIGQNVKSFLSNSGFVPQIHSVTDLSDKYVQKLVHDETLSHHHNPKTLHTHPSHDETKTSIHAPFIQSVLPMSDERYVDTTSNQIFDDNSLEAGQYFVPGFMDFDPKGAAETLVRGTIVEKKVHNHGSMFFSPPAASHTLLV